MTIGQVAAESGLAASAIRFYEQEGVVPRPARIAGRRHYDASVPDQLAMLERAKACGFSLAEIRRLIHGFREGTPPSWRFPRICVCSDFLLAQWTWCFALLTVIVVVNLASGCL